MVGSLNVDFLIRLERMPDPGETVFGQTLEHHAGGKGLNQAVAAARLGASVAMVGAVGNDATGTWLRSILTSEAINDSGVHVTDVTSGTALIEVDAAGDNRIVVVPGANDRLTPDHVESALAAIEDLAVVLSQGEVPTETIETALRIGRERGARTIFNPAPVKEYPASLLALTDIVVPNEREARLLTGMNCSSLVDAVETARTLVERGAGCAVITRGARGAVWATSNGSGSSGTFPVTTIDTVAAGDAFCGTLAAVITEGLPIADALRWASAAGALATTVKGAVRSLPQREAVEALVA